MNDLLSKSFSGSRVSDIEMENTAITRGTNLEKFFENVAEIKDELKVLENIHNQLQNSNEQSKTLYQASSIKILRTKMDNEVALSLTKAKLIKNHLQSLDRSNETNRNLPGCGPGSSTDRTRISIVNGLRKQLQSSMKSFIELRLKMASEHRETVQKRYYSVTGENADDAIVDELISTGESEMFLQKAIEEKGRGQLIETILKIQERHDAVTLLERNLKELHQVFLDMAILVESQGDELDDIESHVNRANSFVSGGTKELHVVKNTQMNTRKWTCFGIFLLLIIITVISVLSVRPWN